MANKQPKAPDANDKNRSSIILRDGYDTETGVPGKGCSTDNGVHFTVYFTSAGLMLHQQDTKTISKNLTFEKLRFKSPDGTAFYLSVDDDGTLKTTKVGEQIGDSAQG